MGKLILFDSKKRKKHIKKQKRQELKNLKRDEKARIKEKRKGGLFIPPVRRSFAWVWILLLLIAVVALSISIARDNTKITVNRVAFVHEQIPKAFDGYTILQITDLHGKSFGTMQKRLAKLINSLDYDMILMTGDYLENPKSEDYYVILDLIDALEKETPIYYILGESDYRPSNVKKLKEEWNICINPVEKTPIMEELEKVGCKFVYPIQRIEKGGESIFLTGTKYYEKQFDEVSFDSDKNFSICVTHRPINYNVQRRLDEANLRGLYEVDFDASISGHTIGGHVRLPLLGALFTDDKGFLPEEQYAYGLSEDSYGRLKFISSGLGTTGAFKFRVFNTPEVALITLRYEDIENK